ncbi:MAG: DoxX family protein [Rhizobiales bacterium 65-79]|jgi:putative oxidoreductase|nr:DoxX family protein [Hyphomicrobiales bacterium]OJU04364.1 MAG: DoxX family protein [Rhizobiales bacterium 65-79]
MQLFERVDRYRPWALAALRIVAALLFIEHGTQKLFDFPASGHAGGSLGGLFLVAALLESIGGLLVLVGLFTRPVAFLLAGEMAIAYFMAHFPKSFFPIQNGGEAAVLFCFVFLYLVFAGAGALALDNRRSS